MVISSFQRAGGRAGPQHHSFNPSLSDYCFIYITDVFFWVLLKIISDTTKILMKLLNFEAVEFFTHFIKIMFYIMNFIFPGFEYSINTDAFNAKVKRGDSDGAAFSVPMS